MTQSNPAMLSDRLSDREAEKREFKWALRIGFTAFLVIALVSRLLPRSWRPITLTICMPPQGCIPTILKVLPLKHGRRCVSYGSCLK